MTCPKCGSTDIRTSKRKGWLDSIRKARGLEPYRCRKCRHRFFLRDFAPAPATAGAAQINKPRRPASKMSPREKSRLMRRLVTLAVFGLISILFLLFLRYVTTDRQPPADSGAVHSPAGQFLAFSV
jgi:ribosomal protein L40E